MVSYDTIYVEGDATRSKQGKRERGTSLGSVPPPLPPTKHSAEPKLGFLFDSVGLDSIFISYLAS